MSSYFDDMNEKLETSEFPDIFGWSPETLGIVDINILAYKLQNIALLIAFLKRDTNIVNSKELFQQISDQVIDVSNNENYKALEYYEKRFQEWLHNVRVVKNLFGKYNTVFMENTDLYNRLSVAIYADLFKALGIDLNAEIPTLTELLDHIKNELHLPDEDLVPNFQYGADSQWILCYLEELGRFLNSYLKGELKKNFKDIFVSGEDFLAGRYRVLPILSLGALFGILFSYVQVDIARKYLEENSDSRYDYNSLIKALNNAIYTVSSYSPKLRNQEGFVPRSLLESLRESDIETIILVDDTIFTGNTPKSILEWLEILLGNYAGENMEKTQITSGIEFVMKPLTQEQIANDKRFPDKNIYAWIVYFGLGKPRTIVFVKNDILF